MSKLITRADAHLAGQLDISVRDLHRMAFRAGADAIRRIFEEHGEVHRDLQLVAGVADAPTGTLPVFLPEGMVRMTRAMVEDIADLDGGVEDYVAGFLESMLSASIRAAHPHDGIVGDIKDGYDLPDPDRVIAQLVAEARCWEECGSDFRKKEGVQV